MMYSVRALSTEQLVVRLSVSAADAHGARVQVESMGLVVASLEPQRPLTSFFGKSETPLPRDALLLFSQELSALITAGLSLFESLEALAEKEDHGAMAAMLARLLTGLREGKRFSSVLAEQPGFFSALFVSLIQSAEGTSDLPQALSRFVGFQQRRDALRNKLISAAIYPAILLTVGVCVTFFLLAYVVPKFSQVYAGSGRELPWLSTQLLSWGKFSSEHSASILATLLTCVTLSILYFRRYGKDLLSTLLLGLPGIGERLQVYQLSQVYLTLGMLLEGGIPVVSALNTVAGAASAELKAKLSSAKLAIESGESCSKAFDDQALATPISLRMLRVGERTGQLGPMLTQSAAFYDSEMNRWLDRFTRAFEPILMAIIGVVVGTIVVVLYLPVFDLAGSFS